MSGPMPQFLLPVTAPLAWGYERIIRVRNARYDRGSGIGKLSVPVISVGNMTTGGVGKSPMVAWIARVLLEAGHQPAIAMRGYGATLDTPADETLEYQQSLPDIPVIADPDRLTAARSFLEQHEHVDRIILDDGFQHRRVHRELDIVLIDATQKTFADRLLPAGNLREPLDSLKRADAVIVTRARGFDETLASQIEYYHHKPPLAWSRHRWTKLLMYEPAQDQPGECNVNWLAGKRVVTLLGVGNPKTVIQQIEEAGANVLADIPARDHEVYSSSKLTVARGLCDGIDALVVTAKDWVKLREMQQIAEWPVPIIVPVLEIDVFKGENAFRDRLMSIG